MSWRFSIITISQQLIILYFRRMVSMQTRLHAKNGVIGEGVKFERIRRVTGYLVGTLDRFNDGKRAEERDRVKHMSV